MDADTGSGLELFLGGMGFVCLFERPGGALGAWVLIGFCWWEVGKEKRTRIKGTKKGNL